MNPLGTPHLTPILNTTLHWTDAGRGRPVVFLHGLADCHATWRQLAATFPTTRYRVLLPDLPGHGLSSRPDADYSLDYHANIVGHWIDSLGLDTFDVVGHSFGGGVAQALLLTHAERVQRVALIAPGGLGRDVAWGVRLLSLPGAGLVTAPFLRIGTGVALRFTDARVRDPAEREEIVWMNSRPGTARALARTARGIAGLGGQRRHFLDQAHAVARLPPIAMYWGSRDPIIPVSHGRATLSILRDASLTVFRGCGHFPHRQVPVPFSAALLSFLEDESVRPARVVVPAALPPRPPWWKRLARYIARLGRVAAT